MESQSVLRVKLTGPDQWSWYRPELGVDQTFHRSASGGAGDDSHLNTGSGEDGGVPRAVGSSGWSYDRRFWPLQCFHSAAVVFTPASRPPVPFSGGQQVMNICRSGLFALIKAHIAWIMQSENLKRVKRDWVLRFLPCSLCCPIPTSH